MFLLVTLIPRILHWYGSSEDHYASTISLSERDSARLDLLTPAQILDQRLDEEIHQPAQSRPFVIVTSTGGGLHASAWTARVLEQLNYAFVMLDKENNERTAKNNNAQAQASLSRETGLFYNHILLLSTVSGSSVGVSYYLREISPATNGGTPNFKRMIVAAQCSSLEAVGWGLVYYDLPKAAFPVSPLFPSSSGNDDLDASPLGKDRTWALRKGIERNVYDDYCLASADGTESKEAKKGAAGHFPPHWYQRLWFSAQPQTRPMQTLAGLRATKNVPAFTMNTTTVETGDRFLLANYRLPKYLIGQVEGPPAESFLDVFRQSPHADLPIPTAAQLSATFPYVSSAARIPAKYGGGRSEHFVDGGYYDDDGTSSAIEFLRFALSDASPATLKDEKAIADSKYPKTVHDKLAKVSAGKLRIILIEIRNSKDSDPPDPNSSHIFTAENPKDSPSGLIEQSVFPLEGFWNAGHSSVTGRDRNGLDLLLKAQGSDLQIHHIILDNHTDSISQFGIKSADDPLSWSLTPHEREQIRESADRNNGLGPCYEEVKNYFEKFDSVNWGTPRRCSGRPPVKQGAKVTDVR
jgi:hypothetical protein